MNNTWILAAIVAVAVVVGGYYFFSGKSDMTLSGENMSEEESTEAKANQKLTLTDIFFMGEDFRCEFAHDDESNKSSGVAYIADAGERIRVDFEVKESAAGSMSGSVIRKDNYSYLWSSSMEQGIKVTITEDNKQDLFAGGQEGTVDENTEFDCVSWVENPAMFDVPSDIEFMDIRAAASGAMDASKMMDMYRQ